MCSDFVLPFTICLLVLEVTPGLYLVVPSEIRSQFNSSTAHWDDMASNGLVTH